MIGVVVALFLGLGLLVLGAWLGVKLALVPSVIVLEHAGIRTAIARSWRLTDGSYWRTFGVLLLVGVILNIGRPGRGAAGVAGRNHPRGGDRPDRHGRGPHDHHHHHGRHARALAR